MDKLRGLGRTSLTNDSERLHLENIGISRRQLVMATTCLAMSSLTGCASNDDDLVGNHLKIARTLLWAPKAERTLTREKVAKYPYASMAIKVGRRPEQLILLSRYEGQKLLWLSGDQIMIVTKNGRIVQTEGLRKNLRSIHFPHGDPVSSGLLNADGARTEFFLDYPDEYGLVIKAKSSYRVLGADPISVLGVPLPTIRVDERVSVPKLKWRYKNRYWVHEKTQFVWRTIQHFHPENSPYQLTMLRPAKLPG